MIQGAPDGWGYLTPDNFTPADYICGRLRIPNNQAFLAAVMGALVDLTSEESWEPFGTMTPTDAAYLALTMYNDFVFSRGTCMIGYVFPGITATTPTGCLLCDGSTFLRVDYPDLYSVLHAAFIVDADHFTVPDLRGLTVVGVGSFETITVAMNEQIGESEHVLIEDELPAHNHTNPPHTHTLTPHSHAEGNATLASAAPPVPPAVVPSAVPSLGSTGAASDGISSDSITIDATGANEAHNNVQPSRGLPWYVIAK